MARSLGLSKVPTLDPEGEGEYPSYKYVQGLVRALNQNFEIINSAYGGTQSTANFLNNTQLGSFTGVWEDDPDPVLSQAGAVAANVALAKYFFIGDIIIYKFHFSVTGTGTANNIVLVKTPTDIANVGNPIHMGSGFFYDASAGTVYNTVALINGSNTVNFQVASPTSGARLGVSPNIALASGDVISGTLVYEVG